VKDRNAIAHIAIACDARIAIAKDWGPDSSYVGCSRGGGVSAGGVGQNGGNGSIDQTTNGTP
jgi:hypothetical protein